MALPTLYQAGQAAAATPARRQIRRHLIAAFAFSAVINALLLSMPLYSLQVFSRAIPSGNLDTLLMLTIIVVLALGLMAGLDAVRTQVMTRAGNLLDVAYRAPLTRAIMERGVLGRHDMSGLAELAETKAFLGRPTCTALMDLPWLPLYLVGIWLIHPLIALIIIVGSGALIGLAALTEWSLAQLERSSREGGGAAARMLDALFGKADTVRGLGMHRAALANWDGVHQLASASTAEMTERMGWLGGATKLIRYLLQIAVTGVAATLVIDHALSMGGMIATSLLVGRAMQPVDQLAGGWTSLRKSLGAARRLWPKLRALDAQPQLHGDEPGPGRLVVRQASVTAGPERRPVLRNISFDLAPGEVLSVFGPNRGGKSTLAKLLVGAQAPQSGDVRVDGIHVAVMRPADPRRAIGYLPQQPELLPGTIGQNISRFLPDAKPEEIVDAARAAGVHELIAGLPRGYDTEVGEVEAMLKGGTERLISLARAVFGQPPLLVLDEPLTNLDLPSAECVRRCLAAMRAEGTTVVILSHLGTLLDMSDKVMVLTDGTVAAFGPRDQVIGPPQRRPHALTEANGHGQTPQVAGAR
jgi:PrtD family type I secretion system ABC transporter